MLEAK